MKMLRLLLAITALTAAVYVPAEAAARRGLARPAARAAAAAQAKAKQEADAKAAQEKAQQEKQAREHAEFITTLIHTGQWIELVTRWVTQHAAFVNAPYNEATYLNLYNQDNRLKIIEELVARQPALQQTIINEFVNDARTNPKNAGKYTTKESITALIGHYGDQQNQPSGIKGAIRTKQEYMTYTYLKIQLKKINAFNAQERIKREQADKQRAAQLDAQQKAEKERIAKETALMGAKVGATAVEAAARVAGEWLAPSVASVKTAADFTLKGACAGIAGLAGYGLYKVLPGRYFAAFSAAAGLYAAWNTETGLRARHAFLQAAVGGVHAPAAAAAAAGATAITPDDDNWCSAL
jgi:hypothetical protein